MPGRSFNESEYRYGAANGQEKVDEISGSGNHYTAEYWEYDSRTLRRWNIDPVVKEHESPYATFANNPIWFSDPNGADTSGYDNAINESGSSRASRDLINGSSTYLNLLNEFAKDGGKYKSINLSFQARDLTNDEADGKTQITYNGKDLQDIDVESLPANFKMTDLEISLSIDKGILLKGDESTANKTVTLVHELTLHANSFAKMIKGNENVQGLKKDYMSLLNNDSDHETLKQGKATLYNASSVEIMSYHKKRGTRAHRTSISNETLNELATRQNGEVKGTLRMFELLDIFFESDKKGSNHIKKEWDGKKNVY